MSNEVVEAPQSTSEGKSPQGRRETATLPMHRRGRGRGALSSSGGEGPWYTKKGSGKGDGSDDEHN